MTKLWFINRSCIGNKTDCLEICRFTICFPARMCSVLDFSHSCFIENIKEFYNIDTILVEYIRFIRRELKENIED